MDKVDQRKRNEIFENRVKQFELKEDNFTIRCFPTSIWENSLYKAWSDILGDIIPNNLKIKELLGKYSIACQVDDVALFEKNTFLCISSFNIKNIRDNERYENICGLMKKLKNTLRKEGKTINNFLLKNIGNIIYYEEFEKSTYIMVVFSNNKTSLELIKINIQIIKKKFNDIINK